MEWFAASSIATGGVFPFRIVVRNDKRVRLTIGLASPSSTLACWVDNTVTDSIGIIVPSVPPFLVIDQTNYGQLVLGEWWVGAAIPFAANLWIIEGFDTATRIGESHAKIIESATDYHNNYGRSHPAGKRLSSRIDYPFSNYQSLYSIFSTKRRS